MTLIKYKSLYLIVHPQRIQNKVCIFSKYKLLYLISVIHQIIIYRVQMSGAYVTQPIMVEVEAAEVPVICTPLERPSILSGLMASFGDLELADPPQDGRERDLSVDILIGLDCYWQLMGTGCLRSD